MPETNILPTSSEITRADRWDHFLTRWGYKRGAHRVEPGLYALGKPEADSPVYVTANYALSFDALRSSLAGMDGYILVLDTKGVNVWCAAGKGSFGTDELVNRIKVTGLKEVVNHRIVILPQLGGPGVAAHEVKKRSKFRVEYGPVRAKDLPEYMKTRQATPEMRRVTFNMMERLVLIPVEISHYFLWILVGMVVLGLLSGWLTALAAAASVFAGIVLFPLLLPWIPTRDFSSQGFLLGGLVAIPFAAYILSGASTMPVWMNYAWAGVYLLCIPSVTSYLSLNFTGSTTFASKTGVEREMKIYIRIIAGMFGIGSLLLIGLTLFRWIAL
ncbi:MAG: hypothetical protein MUO76_23955 [Anaerolineaceae bacterium]|nr:hypothetical protein [Anaerolineaceae bacterium]